MNKTRKPQQPGIGIAALAVALNASGEIQLTPAGEFRGSDGRPSDAPRWVMDAKSAAAVIAYCSARKTPFVIDYEHQTLLAQKNGQPAPAAGWFTGSDLTFREGEGLFAKVQLTDRAREFIGSGEYKFVSPVLYYTKGTGRIVGLHSAALTNTPAIDGMDEVIARAAASFTFDDTTNKEKLSMDIEDLLEQLRWLLNLPTMATKDDVLAELQKAVAAIKSAQPVATAAAGFSIANLVSSLGVEIVGLKSAAPDPSRFVSVDVMNQLKQEVADLRNEKAERDVDGVVSAALSTGKLLPAQEAWARELGKTNLALLKQHVDAAQPIAALNGMQNGGKPPEARPAGDLSEAEMAMCRSMGVSPEDFKKTKLDLAQA